MLFYGSNVASNFVICYSSIEVLSGGWHVEQSTIYPGGFNELSFKEINAFKPHSPFRAILYRSSNSHTDS